MDSGNSTDSSCHVCKKKFKSPEKLSLHMRFHSLFGNFKKTALTAESSADEVNETNSRKFDHVIVTSFYIKGAQLPHAFYELLIVLPNPDLVYEGKYC